MKGWSSGRAAGEQAGADQAISGVAAPRTHTEQGSGAPAADCPD